MWLDQWSLKEDSETLIKLLIWKEEKIYKEGKMWKEFSGSNESIEVFVEGEKSITVKKKRLKFELFTFSGDLY